MAERHAERAQGADHLPALLEGEAHGAVDDEEAHGEAEEPEGGEVEVEAFGQRADVGVLVGGLEAEVGGDLIRLQVSHASPVGGFTALRPALPVTIWSGTR